jgi:hypothetical protein
VTTNREEFLKLRGRPRQPVISKIEANNIKKLITTTIVTQGTMVTHPSILKIRPTLAGN